MSTLGVQVSVSSDSVKSAVVEGTGNLEALLDALDTAAAAAVAIGASDSSAEVDAADTAAQAVIAAYDATEAAALTAAVAAAQAIGAGDASTENAAVAAAATALRAAKLYAGVTVIIDTVQVTDVETLRKALDKVIRVAQASGGLTTI